MDGYDPYAASQALTAFVESLSNWYLRRSRDRFWRAWTKDEGQKQDKLDAWWTLYEALVTTTLLIAPFTPFAAEELYQVLVRSASPGSAPESVHLCEYPRASEFPVDEELSRGMMLAREVAALGRSARAQAGVKVRMPLSEVTVVPMDPEDTDRLGELMRVWLDELNVTEGEVLPTEPGHVSFQAKPNFKALGPRLGKAVKELASRLADLDGSDVRKALREQGSFRIRLSCGEVALSRGDLDMRASAKCGYSAVEGPNVLVILDTRITEQLSRKGIAREIVNRIQTARKLFDLPYEARIETYLNGPERIMEAVREHEEYIRSETLSVRLLGSPPEQPIRGVIDKTFVEGEEVEIALGRAEARTSPSAPSDARPRTGPARTGGPD
jgi:isoleucyl-tRNA synthetase